MAKITDKSVIERLNDQIKIGDKTKSLRCWLDDIGLSYAGYESRLRRGLSVAEALTMPKHVFKNNDNEKEKKIVAKKMVYKFVKNGSAAGTWKWVEE